MLDLGHHLCMTVGDPRGKPTIARFALAANVKHLMENYSTGFSIGISPSELQKGCGVSSKTIRRIINPYSDTGPSLESIDAIALFFKVESWELLMPRPPLLQTLDAQPPRPGAPAKNRS